MKKIIAFLLALTLLAACGIPPTTQENSNQLKDDASLTAYLAEHDALLIDVRTAEEYNNGHIPSALLLPLDEIPQNAATLLPDKEQALVVYCRSGRRSATATKRLEKAGYHNIQDFGGINKWKGNLEKVEDKAAA